MVRLPKTTSSYTPGKWTSGDHPALFVETPRGVWKAMAHKDDSTWSVRGPDPDNPLHYADGEVHTSDADVTRGDAEGRFAVAKKRARAYITAQLALEDIPGAARVHSRIRRHHATKQPAAAICEVGQFVAWESPNTGITHKGRVQERREIGGQILLRIKVAGKPGDAIMPESACRVLAKK